jgi:mxaJ protein
MSRFATKSRLVALVALLAAFTLAGGSMRRAEGAKRATLRVCADPNELPFSNRAEQGFENRLARLLARELGADVEYTWWAQRRGFLRQTLKAGRCDVVLGVPQRLEAVATTRPYCRASYAFVSQRERGYDIASYDDPRLRYLKVGVQLIGDDGVNSPPAHALGRRGIVNNVVGFSVLGDYAGDAPLAAPVKAVDDGAVDLAIVWGPVAGYFAKHAQHKLAVVPLSMASDAGVPQSFDIAVGVRRSDRELLARLDAALGRRAPEVKELLVEYGFESGEAVRP